MDRLKECALSFSKLFNIEYHILVGRKGKLFEINLHFHKEHFHHLIGLHKVNDIKNARGNKVKVFDRILNNDLTYNDISKSNNFHKISDRFENFTCIENMIDSEETMFKHNKNVIGTDIEAEYIVFSIINNKNVHLFINIDDVTKKYFGCSFFQREDKRYITGRPYVVLKKVKFIDLEDLDNLP